jgi:hypothetical protein
VFLMGEHHESLKQKAGVLDAVSAFLQRVDPTNAAQRRKLDSLAEELEIRASTITITRLRQITG